MWCTVAEGGEWTGSFQVGYEGDKAFDGKTTPTIATQLKSPSKDRIPSTCTWNGYIQIPAGASVTASVWFQSEGSIKVNNVPMSLSPDINALQTVDITAAAGSEITTLEIERTPGF